MSHLVYAVVPAAAASGLVALDWHPQVAVGGPLGLVHEVTDRRPEPEAATVVGYGRRQLELGEVAGASLPMRFGSVVADEAALHELFAERGEGWLERLDVVAGCVELVVHAGPADTVRDAGAPDPPSRRSGRSYLEERARAQRAATALAAEVRDVVRPLVRESRLLPAAPAAPEATRLACLVPREAVDGLTAVVADWSGHRGVTARVSGPLPVLDFVDRPEEETS